MDAMHPMERATQQTLTVLLGGSTLYLVVQQGSSFLTLMFGLLIVGLVGRHLWTRSQETFSAAITTCLIVLFILLARPA